MGPFCGLLLMLVFCTVEVLSQANNNDEVYQCQYNKELYRLMIAGSLNGSSCVESQLTDASRYQLDLAFNQYRANINFSNVFQMNYHWFCEYFGAYILNRNLSTTSPIENQTRNEIYYDIRGASPDDESDFKIRLGTFEDILLYDYTIYEIPINVSGQSEFVEGFRDRYREYLKDPFLESEGGKRVWPGTTYFGCVIYINAEQQDPKNPNRMICVFATHRDADREFKEGIIGEESCGKSKPSGFFDSNRKLCVDKKIRSVSHENDVPCQFFYNVKIPNFAPMMSCKDFDPRKGGGWKQPPGRFTKMVINYLDKKITLTLPIESFDGTNATTGEPVPDGALKLHSIQISVIVFIASISFIFGQFFSKYT